MFKFFKDKLKSTLGKFSEEIDKEGKEEKVKEKTEEKEAKKKESEKKEETKKTEEKKESEEKEETKETGKEKGEESKETEESKGEKREEEESKGKEADEEKTEESGKEEGVEGKETKEESQETEKEEGEEKGKEETKEKSTETEKSEKEGKEEAKESEEEKTEESVKEGEEEGEEKKSKETEEESKKTGKEGEGEEKEESEEEPKESKKGKRRGIFQWITTKKISEDKFEELFWELETALLENNVSIQVIEKIKEDLKEDVVDKPIKRKEIGDKIRNSLKESLREVLSCDKIDISEKIKEKKPYVICFLGVNGSGKTTTIAKIANKLKKENNKVVMAAADTFRAAAIDQLDEHGRRLDVPVIKQVYGADPSAVVYDAISHAKKEGKDVVLVDTAGRLHSNVNLVDELKKMVRVNNPDMKIYVGESLTGNDCVDQAERFDSSVGIDGTILTKADVDEKGGAAISVSYVTGKPIIYLGTGQEYDDIKEFDSEEILENLGL